MSRFHSYLNSSASILQLYKGAEPFSIFLKAQFAQHKKFGSRDRKAIAHLCYCYFRLGQALLQVPVEERILAGLFLNEQQPNELLQQLKPDWNELIALPADAKANMLGFSVHDIFPWRDELSNGINADEWSASFLIQPDLFLRLRPGKEELVKQKLRKAPITFNPVSHTCISLNNSVKLDNVIKLDEEAVVQDYNSQRVGEFLDYARNFLAAPSTPLRVYDCCAASGGKSILAYDVLKNIELTVTDVRESILINLRKRFALAGIKKYDALAIDLTSGMNSQNTSTLKPGSFDLVICDAPCTGSGTWGRTPEQLYNFRKERIDHYTNLQESILSNVLPFLKEDGLLLYITCSLFRRENEQMVEFLEKEHKLQLKKLETLIGYDKKADSMFAALLMKTGG
jgi:16S rRNA (cytosine967-C5)-methyltransferase